MMKRIQKEPIKKKKKTTRKYLQTVKGMKDLLPQDHKYWDFLEKSIVNLAKDYSFKKIMTPVLEHPNLFSKGLTKKSDIVKDLFLFDSEEESLCLRPELTLPIIRSYIEHNMAQLPHPLKLYSIGPVYKQKGGKYKEARQLHQLGCFIIGEDSPIADVQVILFLFNILKPFDFNLSVNINSTGCEDCRDKYREALSGYYKGKKKLLCEQCQSNIAKSPLYILNCYEECCCQLKVDAPQSVDWLCEKCKQHFIKVLEALDELDIPYVLNPYIVSGFDFRAKTVFEIVENPANEGGTPLILGAGARHDELTRKLGGESTPLVSTSFIFESVIKRIRQCDSDVFDFSQPDVFVAQIGEMAKRKSLVLFESLRKEGISIAEGFSKDDLRTQFEMAMKLDVKYTLILGQKEILDGTIIIRDMDGGVQEIIDFDKVALELKKRLGKNQK